MKMQFKRLRYPRDLPPDLKTEWRRTWAQCRRMPKDQKQIVRGLLLRRHFAALVRRQVPDVPFADSLAHVLEAKETAARLELSHEIVFGHTRRMLEGRP
jgi:hypothetical protein